MSIESVGKLMILNSMKGESHIKENKVGIWLPQFFSGVNKGSLKSTYWLHSWLAAGEVFDLGQSAFRRVPSATMP